MTAQTRASADGRVIKGLEMKRLFAAIAVLISSTSLAGALTLVAVVEDVQGNVTGAELMDYVVPGQVIKLGSPGGMIVLGYMKSCWRETISGIGAVIVGTEQSGVQLADVKAEKVPCDPKQSDKLGREVGERAATVVRSAKNPGLLVVHGVSPIITTPAPGKLLIERQDQTGERYELDARGKFLDLAKANIALKPGGLYSARLDTRQIVFKVDREAAAGASPIVGRLVRLQ
jgi:hypothetical protein